MSEGKPIEAILRLREAFHLWHKAAESYEAPEEFRIYLNACIQALRNATFVLQKQKTEIEDFEKWYSEWQAAFKADRVMSWCVTARNRIVKEGDLLTQSTAVVSYVSSYLEAPEIEFKAAPFASTVDIAKEIIAKHLPKKLQKGGYLKVERRWVAEDLPDYELLDALAYVFSVLAQLVTDLDIRAGPHLTGLKDSSEESYLRSAEAIGIDKSKLPHCMSSFVDWRTVWVKLPTMEVMSCTVMEEAFKPVPKEYIAKRYGPMQIPESEAQGASQLQKLAFLLLNQAKRMLQVDGHLVFTIFMIGQNEDVTMLPLKFEDHDQKYVIWSVVAEEIARKGIIAIITIGEAWMAPYDPECPTRRPEDSPKRQEVIQVCAISRDGQNFAIHVPFHRRKEKISFQQEEVLDDYTANFLKPIQRVWAQTA